MAAMAARSATGAGVHSRVALVTDGGSGVGRGVARRLAQAGARVAVTGADGGGRDLADEIDGTYVHLDVGDAVSWEVAVEDVTDQLGSIDIVHVLAGAATGEADITKVTDEAYRHAMAVSVDGLVHALRAVVPGMRLRGGGAIVVTASLEGLRPSPEDPIHSMTQHAVVALVRSLAEGLGPDNIRINALCSGPVDAGSPEAIADVVLELADGDMTGEVWCLQPGGEPRPYRFGDEPPGPRT